MLRMLWEMVQSGNGVHKALVMSTEESCKQGVPETQGKAVHCQ